MPNGSFDYKLRIKALEHWLDGRNNDLDESDSIQWLSILSDCLPIETDEKELRRQLKKYNKELLRSVSQNDVDGLVWANQRMKCYYKNQQIFDMLNFTPDEIIEFRTFCKNKGKNFSPFDYTKRLARLMEFAEGRNFELDECTADCWLMICGSLYPREEIEQIGKRLTELNQKLKNPVSDEVLEHRVYDTVIHDNRFSNRQIIAILQMTKDEINAFFEPTKTETQQERQAKKAKKEDLKRRQKEAAKVDAAKTKQDAPQKTVAKTEPDMSELGCIVDAATGEIIDDPEKEIVSFDNEREVTDFALAEINRFVEENYKTIERIIKKCAYAIKNTDFSKCSRTDMYAVRNQCWKIIDRYGLMLTKLDTDDVLIGYPLFGGPFPCPSIEINYYEIPVPELPEYLPTKISDELLQLIYSGDAKIQLTKFLLQEYKIGMLEI